MTRTVAATRQPAAQAPIAAVSALSVHGLANEQAISATSPVTAIGNTFTVGCWAKMLKTPGTFRQTLMVVNGATNGLQIELADGGVGGYGSLAPFMNGSWQAKAQFIPPLGSWVHLVLTKSGSTTGGGVYGCYVNGTPVAVTKINDNDYADAASQIALGSRGGGQNFFGLIKDAFCYARVLTQAEVLAVMKSRSFPNDSTRRFWYPLDENAGTACVDAFGLAPNLALQATTGWSTDTPYVNRTTIRAAAVVASLSGFEVTDAIRAASLSGDGRAPESTINFPRISTNMVTNGGAEATAAGWAGGVSNTIARSTAQAKFGVASFLSTMGASADSNAGYFTPGVAAVAGNTYASSVWVYIPSGNHVTSLGMNTEGTGTYGTQVKFPADVSKRDQWQQIINVTPVTGSGNLIGVLRHSGMLPGDFIYIDGMQIELGTWPSPYLDTQGATTTRSNCGMGAMSTALVNVQQGWVMARVRPDWPSAQVPNALPRVFEVAVPFNPNDYRVYLCYSQTFNSWSLIRNPQNTGPLQAHTFNAGTKTTLSAYWTPTQTGLSLNGSAHATTPVQGSFYAVGGFGIGGAPTNNLRALEGCVLWIAWGIGTIVDADAITENGWGDTPPTMAQLSALNGGKALPTGLWTMADANYQEVQRNAPFIARRVDGFDPLSLAPTFAYRSDLGVTQSGGKVSQLNDQSGNGWHMIQATGANQPSITNGGLGGKPFLTYNGASVIAMHTAANFTPSDGATEMTMLAVGHVANDFNGGSFVEKNNGGANAHFNIGQVGGSSGNFNFYFNGTGGGAGVNNFQAFQPRINNDAVWLGRYKAGHNQTYRNGVPYSLDAQGVTSGALNTLAATLSLGSGTGGVNGGTATMYAIYGWMRALSDDEIAWVTQYLMDLYQLPRIS